MTNFKRNQASQ